MTFGITSSQQEDYHHPISFNSMSKQCDASPQQQQHVDNVVDDYGSSHFPMKLHKMLEDVEIENHEGIVSWNEGGQSFSIHDPVKFSCTLMPRYFSKQSKYKSFQRQLNLYNFVRSSKGQSKRIYSHPLFIRSNPKLCVAIRRERVKRDSKNAKRKDFLSSLNNNATGRGRGGVRSQGSSSAGSSPTPLQDSNVLGNVLVSELSTMFQTSLDERNSKHEIPVSSMASQFDDSQFHAPASSIFALGPPTNDQVFDKEDKRPIFEGVGIIGMIGRIPTLLADEHGDDYEHDDNESMGTIDDLPATTTTSNLLDDAWENLSREIEAW